MPEINLTQYEADVLISMNKQRADNSQRDYPALGGLLIVPLESVDKREQFLLDVRRSRIDLLKVTYQNRARQVVVLVRLDLGGAPHRNPDGEEIACPHLHVYREGFGNKWAILAPVDKFSNPSDLWRTLLDFMECHITMLPDIQRGLFV